MFDVLVLGAGPAGLFCALQAASAARSAGRRLTIGVLEKNSGAGRKLLLSGSGRCNLTHTGPAADFYTHYGENGKFLKACLQAFPNTSLTAYFESRGVRLAELENGKVFPESGKSGDVLGVLLRECRESGIEIVHKSPAVALSISQSLFSVKTADRVFAAGSVVIATGGKSYPATGSSGDGYGMAAGLGHRITAPRPALAPVLVKDYLFGGCAGNSLKNSPLFLYRENRLAAKGRGDVLFTHQGLSGPGILDMSRYMKAGDEIRISMTGGSRDENFNREFLSRVSAGGRKKLKAIIASYGLSEAVSVTLLEFCGLSEDAKAAELDSGRRSRLLDALCAMPFIIQSTGGFETAMVTAGGICLAEVNPKTMESHLVPGLFFAGEVLDIDGDTGGYNLQAAFSTGWMAGTGIALRHGNTQIVPSS